MPGPLANNKHEVFAQSLAKGETATAAFAAAGYKPHASNPSRLSENERVKARVAELQCKAARLTIETIALTDRDFISRLIREADHYGEGSSHGARVQAVKLIGDHLGLLKQRIEHNAPDRLTLLISEINAQGSAAPIATKRNT